MSIKDRWVGPHEQVLNVPIACWCYGSGMPSGLLSIEACLFPTASLAFVGEKLRTDPWIGRPSSYGLCQEPLFSRSVDLYNFVHDSAKGCYA
jgi:hypothetical protein